MACPSDATHGRRIWNPESNGRIFKSPLNSNDHTDERVRNNPEAFNEGPVRTIWEGILQN